MESGARPAAHELTTLSWSESGVVASIRPDDIMVDRLDYFAWRVRDGRLPREARPSIIGLIELVNERFDVLRFSDLQVQTFPSLDAAVEHLTTAVIAARSVA